MFSTPPSRFAVFLLLLLLGLWLIGFPAVLTPADPLPRQPAVSPSDLISPKQQPNTHILKANPVTPVSADLQSVPHLTADAETLNRNIQNPAHNLLLRGDLNLITSFKAIDYTQSQQGTPPNPALMVGRDHVVVSVNSSFQVFDKNGVSLIPPTLFKDFWGSSCGTGSESMILDYPFSTYDEQAGRYILGIAGKDSAVNNGDNGYLCIAVSQTDSATGLWNLYNFDANPGPGADYPLDFPRAGLGRQALFLGATMFDDFTLVQNRLFAFDKTAMYAGNSADSITIDIDDAYFSIIPANVQGSSAGNRPANPDEPHYFMEAETDNGDEIRVFALDDPWGTPAFNLLGSIPVSGYGLPVDQPQAGTSAYIYGFDNRLVDVEYWNGRLWATHTIGCNPGGSTVNCLRWYEIEITAGITPTLIQEGTFGSSSTYRSYPNLALNACNDMLVGYTKTSSSIFPGVFVAGREYQDSPGQLKSETELHAGEAFYLSFEGQPYRWGYNTAMTIDPDAKTFWYLGEYARLQADSRWSTWVGAFTWSDCEATPTPSPTPSATTTAIPTETPTETQTPTPTETKTSTPTVTPTATYTATPTATPTTIPTATPSETPTSTATSIPTSTPTATPTHTPTPTPTPTTTATNTATPTPTVTPTVIDAPKVQIYLPVVMK